MEHDDIKQLIQDNIDNNNISHRHTLVDMTYACMDIIDANINEHITTQAERSLKHVVGSFIGYCNDEGYSSKYA